MTKVRRKRSAPVRTLQRLDSRVRSEIEKLLHEAHVWRFGSYGWADAETADPDFIGHAMWQVHPPVDFDYLFPNSNMPIPKLTDRQRRLAVAGADFGGLMNAARISTGLFLLQARFLQHNEFSEDNFFDVHRMSAIIYLATASERLREFFIAAVFGVSQQAYAKRPNGSHYMAPFEEAKKTLSGAERPFEALSKLCPLADDIRKLRKERNRLIHEIATAIGRREYKMVTEEPAGPYEGKIDLAALREATAKSKAEHKQQIEQAIEQLAGWYDLLARASNEAFIIEHQLRPR